MATELLTRRSFSIRRSRIKSPMEAGFIVGLDEHDGHVEDPKRTNQYRSLIGTLNYACTACRFDVERAISVMSRHIRRPTDRLLKAAYTVLQYLKTTRDFEITRTTLMSDYENPYRNFLYCAADASFAFCPVTRRSHQGGLIFMNTGLIHYNSSLQQIVALSTAESKLYGLVKLATALSWLRTIMLAIGYDQSPLIILEDNTAAILIGEGMVLSAGRDKHVDIKFQWMKTAIKEKHFSIRYVPSALNYSHGLTKSLVAPGFQHFVRMCIEKKIIGKETIGDQTFVTINKSDSLTSVSGRSVVESHKTANCLLAGSRTTIGGVSRNAYLAELLQADEVEEEMTLEWTNDT